MKNRAESRARPRCRNPDSLHVQRARANKRERERTKALNAAYIELRQKIPSLPSDKTSKIHTLRVTVEYIHFLRELIYNQNGVLNQMDFAVQENNQINLQSTFNSWRTNHNQRWGLNVAKQPTTQRRAAETSEKRKSRLNDSICANKPSSSDEVYSNGNVDYSKSNSIRPNICFLQPMEKMKSEFDLAAPLSSQYTDQSCEPFTTSDCNSASSLGYALGHAINHSHL